jgi:phosphoribosylformylglycinamidine synthase
MVRRIYVEKKPGLRNEAEDILQQLRVYVGLKGLKGLRLLNRYDVEGLSEDDFALALPTVFSEPQTDDLYQELPPHDRALAFALEYLPGQFDQRADSAAQCVELLTQRQRPTVATARVYLLEGDLSAGEVEAAKKYLLNPVESREASFALPDTLALRMPSPLMPPVLEGFRQLDSAGIAALREQYQLAMEEDDVQFCIDHFRKMDRDPWLTELKVIDTYWSDHCRHTTFLTELTDVRIDDPMIRRTYEDYLRLHRQHRPDRPVTLMDLGTLAAKVLKARGRLHDLDESEENNACTVRVMADTIRGEEEWLLLFKNETHNHPTEIEPFGGAATCIGGAIRDPLSARAYVYAAMRVTGAADPTQPIRDTLPGKLPQRQIVVGAANGYSSYGNQIGLATGLVKELYHPGYAAKRLEVGAVLGAAPARHVRRERPAPGDVVILLGGRTGRDGIGGATGSSQAHTLQSVDVCAAQVQKGNAPEERKLQRLFLHPEVSRLIKRCNDFGAGGVAVAIGELAPGLHIDLDRVPRKYEGLDGTELAISESQERMAVVVAAEDAPAFQALAEQENLEATIVARVTEEPVLSMRWRDQEIVSLPRAFLDTNGAPKQAQVHVQAPGPLPAAAPEGFRQELMRLADSLNGCSNRGLAERFDSTIGCGSVLLPFGGQRQLTPPMAMVHRLPVPGGTQRCSFMSYGFDPAIAQCSPYHGGYLAVVEAAASLVAAGASLDRAWLTHQEYFPKPGSDPARWGLPLASLLGAFRAQMELGLGAIGGKDSMSGSFEHLDVPPTLISFAVASGRLQDVVSPELKRPGHTLVWLQPKLGEDGLPVAASLMQNFARALDLMRKGKVAAASTPKYGGAGYALYQMALGNGIGVELNSVLSLGTLFSPAYGSLILELTEDLPVGIPLGRTIQESALVHGDQRISLEELRVPYESKLEGVFPMQRAAEEEKAPLITSPHKPLKGVHIARPRVLIPAFPGTNCEEDTARAFERAGAVPQVLLIRNIRPELVRQSVDAMAQALRQSQIVLIPGGFSGGDEPDGSGKFITAFFRSAPIREAVEDLLQKRRGLVGGICNGFQALIKLGLLPFGRIRDMDAHCPTLTHNLIGRHQSKLVTVRVASNLSPWYSLSPVGSLQTLPISHGEGRFLCPPALLQQLADAGQIATQYADAEGRPSMDIQYNPNGSDWAVESLTSPDGLVMGRMGHAERALEGLYRNTPTTGEDPLFRSAVVYFG